MGAQSVTTVAAPAQTAEHDSPASDATTGDAPIDSDSPAQATDVTMQTDTGHVSVAGAGAQSDGPPSILGNESRARYERRLAQIKESLIDQEVKLLASEAKATQFVRVKEETADGDDAEVGAQLCGAVEREREPERARRGWMWHPFKKTQKLESWRLRIREA